MKTLKNLGFRDVFMEAIIMEEVLKFIDILKSKHLNKKTCFDDIFFLHLLNIVWSIAAGMYSFCLFVCFFPKPNLHFYTDVFFPCIVGAGFQVENLIWKMKTYWNLPKR